MAKDFKNLLDLGGLATNTPADKIADRNASDIANIDLSSQGFIQTKGGYDKFANDITAVGTGLRGYLYIKNFGDNKRIKLRVRDDGSYSYLDWHNPSNPDTADGKWELLINQLTQGAVMGFAPANGNGGSNINLLVLSNGKDNFTTWNGATSLVASVTANTIVSNASVSLAAEGFAASGSIIVDGTTYTYSGLSSKTFTGVSPDPTVQAPIANSGIAQIPDTSTYSANPKGNIILTSQRKLWLSGEANYENRVSYTQTNDVTAFTGGSGLSASGSFTLVDKPGDIKLLDSYGADSLIIHKEGALIKYIRGNDGTNVIEQFDDLSVGSDVGASNLKAGAGLNQVAYYATKSDGVKSLSKAIQDSSLNLSSITDIIRPSIEDYDFTDAASVYYPKKQVIYIACKDSSDASYNNKIISFYIKQNTDGTYTGDFSIDDGYVSDFIVDGSNLYYISSVDQNVYKAFTRNSANGTAINHHWTSKEFTFNEPARGKEITTVYIEGFIANNTKIKVSVIYGLLGSGGEKSVVLEWDNFDYVVSSNVSLLGVDILGVNSLGATSQALLLSYPFSVPIHVDAKKTTRYKIKIETYYDDDTTAEAYWAVSNISTNPSLKTVEYNKMLNSNS